jgi:hypothetical protein
MSNSHDEIRKLLKASREMLAPKHKIQEQRDIRLKYGMISEQESSGYEVFQKQDIGKSVENTINKDISNDEIKSKEYKVSGYNIVLHGKSKTNLQLTEPEMKSFQETVEQFSKEVTELALFNNFNLYPNKVEWSGKISEYDITFNYIIPDGAYVDTEKVKTDDDFLDMVTKLNNFYDKLKAKWEPIIQERLKLDN